MMLTGRCGMVVSAGRLILVMLFRHNASGAERDRDQPNGCRCKQDAAVTTFGVRVHH